MLRSPSLPLRDYDELSSPDPLANSLNHEDTTPDATRSSPMKSRAVSPSKSGQTRSGRTAHSRPRAISSSSSVLQLSPSKTVTEQNLSPWKIRVTVEAEPEDADDNRHPATRTIKIPLRQDSSPTVQATSNGRGRGRNSQPSAAKSKRSGTPLRARSGSRGRRQSLTDLNITVLGDDGDSNDWTKRNSPRKRKTSRSRRKPVEATSAKKELLSDEWDANTMKSQTAADFEIHQDSDAAGEPAVEQGQDSDSPELRRIDLNRVSVRSRPQSAKQEQRKVSENSAMSYPTPSPTSSYHGSSDEREKISDPAEQHEAFDTILESEGFTMIDIESIPSARHFIGSPAVEELVPAANDAALDGSLEGGETHQTRNVLTEAAVPKPKAPSPYSRLDEGDSAISSNMASSPPIPSTGMLKVPFQPPKSNVRKVTPEPYSSPKLPSPPKQIHRSQRSETEQQLLSKTVLRVGMALHGAVSSHSPQVVALSDRRSTKTPSGVQDRLFEGFDSGTKRELRAGLRFGEELAKRQNPSPTVAQPVPSSRSTQAAPSEPKPRKATSIVQNQIWRGEAVVQHTPVSSNRTARPPSLSNAGRSVLEAPLSLKSAPNEPAHSMILSAQTPRTSSSQKTDPRVLDTQARREHEWQLEREAVSRQIENATPGRVIVIDSDSDEDVEGNDNDTSNKVERLEASRGKGVYELADSLAVDDENEDIWLAEAQNSSSSPRNEDQSDLFSHSEQARQRERAAEVVTRPRRSLIPSPCKRGEDVTEANTFLTNGDMSGMLWQQEPQNKIRFGAGEIARQRRQISGGFDVDRMAATPMKLAALNCSSFDNHDEKSEAEQAEQAEQSFDHHTQLVDDFKDFNNSDHYEDGTEPSLVAQQSFTSPSSSPLPTKIPVNFNDSTLSTLAPPREFTPTISHPLTKTVPEAARPSTPRSAMKGSRESLGIENYDISEASPVRRVIFNSRSSFLNDDGVETTMSANFDSPKPEEAKTPEEKISITDEVRTDDPEHEDEDHRSKNEIEDAVDTPKDKKSASGWLGWLWKGQADIPQTQDEAMSASRVRVATDTAPSASLSKYDGAAEQEPDEDESIGPWEPTKAALASSKSLSNESEPTTDAPIVSTETKSTKAKAKARSTPKIPSYLLPPSYPSDPARDPSIPLAVSGSFTNTHFRTLAIIHAKSLRPRFHAPKSIRAELSELLDIDGYGGAWKMDVDESATGLGLFEWRVGTREIEVLERFMTEVEWGWIQAAGGNPNLKCEWGWDVEELAEWLGRVVVGEVVRKEEGKRTTTTEP